MPTFRITRTTTEACDFEAATEADALALAEEDGTEGAGETFWDEVGTEYACEAEAAPATQIFTVSLRTERNQLVAAVDAAQAIAAYVTWLGRRYKLVGQPCATYRNEMGRDESQATARLGSNRFTVYAVATPVLTA